MTSAKTPAGDGLEEYLKLFVEIGTARLDQLDHLVHPNIRFRDPFNDLMGLDDFRRLLTEAREQVAHPEFRILGQWRDEPGRAIVKWHFSGRLPVIGDLSFEGFSELLLDDKGRVWSHVDYWDSTTEFLVRLPLLGWILKQVIRRLGV